VAACFVSGSVGGSGSTGAMRSFKGGSGGNGACGGTWYQYATDATSSESFLYLLPCQPNA